MGNLRRISRRSFLSRVCGASILGLAGCAAPALDPVEEARRPDPMADWWRNEGCTDADTGRHVDPPGQGRRCRGAPPRGRRGDRRDRRN